MLRFSFSLSNIKTLLHVILFWVIFLGVYMMVSFLLYPFIPVHQDMGGMRHGLTGTIWSLLITWLFLKRKSESFKDIGLVWQPRTLLRFFSGMLAGAAIFTVIVLGLLQFTALSIIKTNNHPGAWFMLSLVSILPLAFMEEVAFRAYPLVRLRQAYGLRIAQMIIAIAFALYHIANGWNIVAAFGGTFVWSYVFGLAAAWSGGIAAATGLHVALNLAQSVLDMKGQAGAAWKLSFNGIPSAESVARAQHAGLVLQVLVLIVTIVVMELYIRRKANKKPSSF
jgi:membrane protease YdiL (CAAX protease family)